MEDDGDFHLDTDPAPFPDQEEFIGQGEFAAASRVVLGEDENEDLDIPTIEFASSPAKQRRKGPTVTPSKTSDKLEAWVARKAERYNIDPQRVWWIIERTTGNQKLAVKALKSFLETDGIKNYLTD